MLQSISVVFSVSVGTVKDVIGWVIVMQGKKFDSGSRMRLYDQRNQRLYINAHERIRFVAAAENARQPLRNFALTLLYTGCRLSEALALRVVDLDSHGRLLSIKTLKKRNLHEVREVPIPPGLVEALSSQRSQYVIDRGGMEPDISLWSGSSRPPDRITGYRWIKDLMATADVHGAQASPKGLRHGYGVHAVCSGVQLNMLRKWMGHASINTTSIYANAMGKEELQIADRMWVEQVIAHRTRQSR